MKKDNNGFPLLDSTRKEVLFKRLQDIFQGYQKMLALVKKHFGEMSCYEGILFYFKHFDVREYFPLKTRDCFNLRYESDWHKSVRKNLDYIVIDLCKSVKDWIPNNPEFDSKVLEVCSQYISFYYEYTFTQRWEVLEYLDFYDDFKKYCNEVFEAIGEERLKDPHIGINPNEYYPGGEEEC